MRLLSVFAVFFLAVPALVFVATLFGKLARMPMLAVDVSSWMLLYRYVWIIAALILFAAVVLVHVLGKTPRRDRLRRRAIWLASVFVADFLLLYAVEGLFASSYAATSSIIVRNHGGEDISSLMLTGIGENIELGPIGVSDTARVRFMSPRTGVLGYRVVMDSLTDSGIVFDHVTPEDGVLRVIAIDSLANVSVTEFIELW